MGYSIKKVPYKGAGWKLQFITYDIAGSTNPKAKSPSKIRDVPKKDWQEHGFNLSMSYEQAKSQAKSLNSQAEVKRWAEKKANIRTRLDKEDKVESAFLPEHFVDEFQKEILFEKMARGSSDIKLKNKIESHWRASKRIVREIKLHPQDWNEKAYRFFNLFVKKKMSPSYVQKLLRILNHWGFFISKKEGRPFLPIPAPKGAEAQRIADAFFDKTPNGDGNKSKPLSPELLEKAKSSLLVENYNWLFISVWLGLRPEEIDGLKKEKLWEVTTTLKGKKLLRVYQPKLRTVPKPKRWKVIPIIYPEQKRTLEVIESKKFRRPIYKVMHKYFGGNITLYGGRKNFTDMMLNKGQKFEQISQWMGHMSLDRTYKDYKDRLKTNYEDYDEVG